MLKLAEMASTRIGLLCFLVLVPFAGGASPGDVLNTWGTAGSRVMHPVTAGATSTSVSSLVLQKDGKLLVIGNQTISSSTEGYVLRLTKQGQIDNTYGTNGVATMPLIPNDAVLEGAGSLLVTGEIAGVPSVTRLTATGQVDGAFGTGGRVDFAALGGGLLALQTDGRILVGGRTVLSRLLANGALDTSFGGSGFIQVPQGIGPLGMAVDVDGSILVGGVSAFGSSPFKVARLTPSGGLDATFGGSGVINVPLPGGWQSWDVLGLVVDPDRRILISVEVEIGANRSPAIARLQPDGSLDATFGSGGFVTADQNDYLVGGALALQPDGRILLAYNGDYAPTGLQSELILSRFLPSGAPDTGFGSNGVVVRDFSSGSSNFMLGKHNPVIVDPDGIIYSAAFWGPSGTGFAAVTTLLAKDANNDGSPEAWDLTPAVPAFASVTNALAATPTLSALATISGLDPDVSVPVTTSSGELAVNGSNAYRRIGWVKNGDQIGLRLVSSATPGGTTSMSLTLGGLQPANNLPVALGTPVNAGFSVTTRLGSPGVLAVATTATSVSEGAGSVQLSVTRTGGTTGPVSVTYGTSSGTALGGSDFGSSLGTLSWADGESANKTVTIPITNDGTVEANETFTVTLSNAIGGATIGTAAVTVTITDDDAPAGALGVVNPAIAFNESVGTVVVTVARTGGSAGAVGVSFSTVAGSAQAGSDYVALLGTLSWADGETGSKSITVTILNDSVVEGTEAFTVALSTPTGGASLLAGSAVITVADDDGAVTPATQPAPSSGSGGGGGGSMSLWGLLALGVFALARMWPSTTKHRLLKSRDLLDIVTVGLPSLKRVSARMRWIRLSCDVSAQTSSLMQRQSAAPALHSAVRTLSCHLGNIQRSSMHGQTRHYRSVTARLSEGVQKCGLSGGTRIMNRWVLSIN